MKRRTRIALVMLAGGAVALAILWRGSRNQLVDIGQMAPELHGTDQNGAKRTLAQVRPNYLVVYFYPKDGTPGCTAEACAFRDAWLGYEAANISLYGVSADTQASHAAFAEEHSVPFPLIADPDNTWASAFGVGTILGMTKRVSFVINADGRVVARYPDVDPGVHAAQLLADIRALRQQEASPR